MPKVRVYQLAKELKVQSALILELLDRIGKEVKSDLSSLDSDTAEFVRARIVALLEVEKARIAEERRQEAERLAELKRREAERAEVEEVAEPEAAVEQPVVEQPAAAAPAEKEPPAPAPVSPPPAAEKPEVPVPAPLAATPTAGLPPTVPQPRKPRVFPAQRIPPKLTPAPKRPGAPPRPPGAPAGPHHRPMATRAAPGAPSGAAIGRAVTGKTRRKKKAKKPEVVPVPSRPKPDLPPVPETITLSEAVTVKELSEKLNRKSKDVIAKLLSRGILANVNQPLDPEVAVEVAKEFGSAASVLSFEEETQQSVAETAETAVDAPEQLQPRPPVVTVMGHVDHGKTSLLDSIRATDVVGGEHGGITQHIGAYQVEKKNRKITFLDTPGHEAFTMMRARGAKATDIVVLVVAADDGVKPQTVEAIDHARAAGVPIVVAVNKIDRPDANPDRVKQQLSEQELLVEDYGGDVVSVEVSAKQGTGIEDLLDMLLLVADMQEFKANPDKPATGVVLEARVDRARGTLATVLVQEGTLKVGDPFIAGNAHGKVRAMSDEHGRRVDEAGPATPVEIMGWADEPAAGDLFQAVTDEARARQIASFRQEKARAVALAPTARHVTLESLSREVAEGQVKELPVLLKSDVQGSIEALQKALGELPSDKIKVNVLRASTGAISQADVLLASASNAIVVGFNVRPDRTTAELAREENVEIRLYTVIYDLINEIRQAMVGMLEPVFKESVLGQAEVRQLFKVPKVGIIGGCYVTEGKVARSAEVRLLRDNVVIYTGKVGSLRRFKDDASEVKQGFECGIGIANYNDLKEGDVIEFFVMEEVAVHSL